MITESLLLLLPLAAASGWYAAKRSHEKNIAQDNERLNRSYLIGLNYLLNEEPDKAVDVFIKMLAVDSETVETHLALGALFRRRGEVGRAIRIHQNLIARPQLPKIQRIEALFALGQDYLRAGLLDRAERLFLEVIELDEKEITPARRNLLDIYQLQKRWDAAIEIASKLKGTGGDVAKRVAQYHCELAEEALAKSALDRANSLVERALVINPHCARASILQGESAVKKEQWQKALQAYQQVKEQDASYFSEVVPPLVQCYERLDDYVGLSEYLQNSLAEYPRASVILALAELQKKVGGEPAALKFLAQTLQRRPSLRGLHALIELQLRQADGNMQESFQVLHKLISNLIKNRSSYRCMQCGFTSKVLDWFCLSCKNWETIKPILGVEGE